MELKWKKWSATVSEQFSRKFTVTQPLSPASCKAPRGFMNENFPVIFRDFSTFIRPQLKASLGNKWLGKWRWKFLKTGSNKTSFPGFPPIILWLIITHCVLYTATLFPSSEQCKHLDACTFLDGIVMIFSPLWLWAWGQRGGFGILWTVFPSHRRSAKKTGLRASVLRPGYLHAHTKKIRDTPPDILSFF